MKSSVRLLFSVLFLILSVAVYSQKKPQFFTPNDASNWFYILNDKSLNPTDVFKMNDGLLQISGASSGYLRTKKKYSNFTLNVEWRWTKVLANSGVLVHIQPKDTIWPACYQVQQKADAAGDIICMNGLWAKECTDSVKFTVKKMQTSNEKPLGEWNLMKIVSKNKSLKVWVNGVLQNNISGLTASSGFIGFQNEGKPIEFRNLSIQK
jgi:hypothetical protein